MTELTEQKCVPCEGGIPPLDDKKEEEYLKQVEGWSLERDGIHHIKKEFYFDNFVQSIEFVNKVADILEVSPFTILRGVPEENELEILMNMYGDPILNISKTELEELFCARIDGKRLTREFYMNFLSQTDISWEK